VTLQVVDEKGRSLPDGETGHLVARGGNVSLGYLDEPEETAAILHDGWLWTGDLARRDADGFFFHEGRSKEILKIGGHRVSPVEIEHVLARHPDLTEAAVVGVPDPLMGEVAAAFVVPRPGRAVDEAELRRFCRESMPAYKVPVRFTAVESLPRNEAGKLLRAFRRLKDLGEVSLPDSPWPALHRGSAPARSSAVRATRASDLGTMRVGAATTTDPDATLRVTTQFAPIIESSPMTTPPSTRAPT
jgi:acyl-CoA synthetase (AMP-forming)/AMP-acid ligase II